MSNVLRRLGMVVCLTGLLTTVVAGQNPTYSLEVTSVNSVPLQGGPVNRITLARGDVFTVKLFLRDWSPDGEALRAYQADLDPLAFSSGQAGTIRPVDYETTTLEGEENSENCFVDKSDPQFVHAGLDTLALSDTRSEGYRWLGVLVNPDEARVCAQDGAKYYCGTVRMGVSEDAQGSFTLRLEQIDGLRDPKSRKIIPLDFEDLHIDIGEGLITLRIQSSEPPNGAIDARQPSQDRDKPSGGWDRIELAFNADTGGLTAADFTIEDGTAPPPAIQLIVPKGEVVTLVFDRRIKAGTWTTVTHNASHTSTRVGYLPGDVDNDGLIDARDMLLLISGPEEAGVLPTYRCDIDCDGVSGVTDVLRMIDLLNQAGAYCAAIRE